MIHNRNLNVKKQNLFLKFELFISPEFWTKDQIDTEKSNALIKLERSSNFQTKKKRSYFLGTYN